MSKTIMSCNPEFNLLYWFFLSVFRWGIHVEREDNSLFEKIMSFDLLSYDCVETTEIEWLRHTWEEYKENKS